MRTSVALNRSSTSASTGRFIQSERPRSPRTTWLIQCRYWTWSGWSRPSCGAQARQVLLRRLGAQHDLGGVARREVQHEEDDHRDAEQHGPQMQEPAQQIAAHGARAHFSEIVSTRRSKLGWSLRPCTRFEVAAIWISWSTKTHGASSTRIFCASR